MRTGSKNGKRGKIRYLAVCCLAVMLFWMTGCGKESRQAEEGQAAKEQEQAVEEQAQATEEQAQATREQAQATEEQVQAAEEQVQATEEQVQAAEEQVQAAKEQVQAEQRTAEKQGQTSQAAAGQREGSRTKTDADAAQNKAGQADIGLEQAKNTALAHAGMEASAVTFTKEKLDYDDGRQEYEIEFVTQDTKYEYEIKADDGTVLKVSSEPVDQTKGNRQIQAGITLEEAKAAAVSYIGMDQESVKFTKLELDYDDGAAEYEIEFFADGKEYSFSIDASSGDVLEMEMEND